MSRTETGSVTFSDTTSLNQLRSTKGRTFQVVLRARTANVGFVYVGTDTTLTVSNGYQLDSTDDLKLVFEGTHEASAFRAIATDSGDVLDWIMEMRD